MTIKICPHYSGTKEEFAVTGCTKCFHLFEHSSETEYGIDCLEGYTTQLIPFPDIDRERTGSKCRSCHCESEELDNARFCPSCKKSQEEYDKREEELEEHKQSLGITDELPKED